MHSIANILLLLAGSQGILLSIALCTSGRRKNKSNIFLGLILLVIALELLNAGAMQIGYHYSKQVIPFWLLGSYLILPPALYLFAACTTTPGFSFRQHHYLLFLPAIAEIVAESASFMLNRYTQTSYRLIDNRLWFAFTEVLPVIWMVCVLIVYWQILPRIPRLAIKHRSADLLKTYGFFVVFSILTILWFAESIAQMQIFFVTQNLLTALLFTLGYAGYLKPEFVPLPPDTQPRSDDEPFRRFDDAAALHKIIYLFETQKVYLQPRLSLEDVSTQLELPERYVSHLINTYHATHFSNFVNGYRVKEVMQKISDPRQRHKTLLALAMEAGFSSKSTFNQIFKVHTGQTPSAYFKSALNA